MRYVAAAFLGLMLIVSLTADAASLGTWTTTITPRNKIGGTATGASGQTYNSSSKIEVFWTAPASGDPAKTGLVKYKVVAYQVGSTTVEQTYLTNSSKIPTQGALFTGLKADTSYKFDAWACQDSSCTNYYTAAQTQIKATPTEYWQFMGTSGATSCNTTETDSSGQACDGGEVQLLSTGSGQTAAVPVRYGTDGGALQNYTKMWHTGRDTFSGENTPTVSVMTSTGTATDTTTLSTLTAGSAHVFVKPCDPYDSDVQADCPQHSVYYADCYSNKCNTSVCQETDADSIYYNQCYSGFDYLGIATVKPVPLRATSKIRLFFEAEDKTTKNFTADGVSHYGGSTRIYYLDSQDGFVGDDFNTDTTRTTCGEIYDTSSGTEYWKDWDYSPRNNTAGDCAPTVVIGLDWDSADYGGGNGMRNVMQHDIGYPKLTDWRWNENNGTFMVFNGQEVETLSSGTANPCYIDDEMRLYYVTYNATTQKWSLDEDSSGCPHRFTTGHEPIIVHIGGTSANPKYKMYYTHPDPTMTYTSTDGTVTELERTQLIYANGDKSGERHIIDFEDWESADDARNLVYLWPDGTIVPDCEIENLGDSYVYFPDPSNTDIAYMNANIGGCTLSPERSGFNRATNEGIGFAKLVNP